MRLDVLTVTLNAAIDVTVVVPNFSIGAVNRVSSETSGAGGKGINVAAVLADFGLCVGTIGFWSATMSGCFVISSSKGISKIA